MPKPTLTLSLHEIRCEAIEEIHWLEDIAQRHSQWKWPNELLPLAREFHMLATSTTLETNRIADFTNRLLTHIEKNNLKGFEPFVWRSEALEFVSRQNENA